MNNKGCAYCIFLFILYVVLYGVAVASSAWLIMMLVNYLAPVFGYAVILTFKQALAITILLSVIGGFFKTTVRSSKN